MRSRLPLYLSAAAAVAAGAAASLPPAHAQSMEQRIFASIKANGSLISDHCNQGFHQMGGVDVQNFAFIVHAGASASSSGGRLGVRPYRIVRPVDACSPRLFRALIDSQVIEAEIKFFRPNPSGDGTTLHHYTVELQNARVVSITSAASAVTFSSEPLAASKEIISLTFQTMTLRDEITGSEVVVPAGASTH